jgi:hypothetical protein
MLLLTVAPLAKGIPYEELSYFSKLEVHEGDLVEITIRKRVCRALVIRVDDVEDEKQSLKHASFIAKKLSLFLLCTFSSAFI